MADLKHVIGETAKYRLVATRTDYTKAPDDPLRVQPLDLRGQKVWFTAKLAKGVPDSAAIVQKATSAAGGAGIVVDVASPGNVATITFAEGDGAALGETTQLAYDVKAEIDSTDVSVLEIGTLTLELGVTD